MLADFVHCSFHRIVDGPFMLCGLGQPVSELAVGYLHVRLAVENFKDLLTEFFVQEGIPSLVDDVFDDVSLVFEEAVFWKGQNWPAECPRQTGCPSRVRRLPVLSGFLIPARHQQGES